MKDGLFLTLSLVHHVLAKGSSVGVKQVKAMYSAMQIPKQGGEAREPGVPLLGMVQTPEQSSGCLSFRKLSPLCYPVGHQRCSEGANSEDFRWGGAGAAHPSRLRFLDIDGWPLREVKPTCLRVKLKSCPCHLCLTSMNLSAQT